MAASVVSIYGLVLLIGVLVVIVGLHSLLTGVLIWYDDLDTVADAASGGRVSLKGTATSHEETMEAPLTDRECLGYNYKKKSGEEGGSNTERTEAVPFLLEREDGTVLVRGASTNLQVRDDHEEDTYHAGGQLGAGDMDTQHEWLLLPGETTYVSGTARSPAEAKADVEVPSGVDAVLTPPRADEGGLRSWLSPLSFYVSDASKGESARRRLRRGSWMILVGVAVPAVAIYLIRRFVAPAV